MSSSETCPGGQKLSTEWQDARVALCSAQQLIGKLSCRDLGYGGWNAALWSISVHRMTLFCIHTSSWFKMETLAWPH